MDMWCSLSPIHSNIYIESFEKLVLDSAQYKPSLWLHYIDDTFLIWLRDPKQLQSAHVVCLTNRIGQPSLDISPIWIHLISNEVTNSEVIAMK
jgi:hypothetical protein